MAPRNVTIIGAGAAGCATVSLLARKGVRITLYNRWPEPLDEIRARDGLQVSDASGDSLVPVDHLTGDMGTAVAGADLVLVATLVAAQRWIAHELAPHLRPGLPVLVLCGNAGTLEMQRIWRQAAPALASQVLLGETVTMPASARMQGPAAVAVRSPVRMRAAAFPATRTGELLAAVDDILPLTRGANVLDVGLNNPNILLHPLPVVLNYAAAERANGQLSLLTEGMTVGVRQVLAAADSEKARILRALALEPLTLDDLYAELGTLPVHHSTQEPMGFKDRIHPRYIDEDVPFGSMMISSFGRQLGLDTPLHDAANVLASALTGRDYGNEARTCARLGLEGLTPGEMVEHVRTGIATATR